MRLLLLFVAAVVAVFAGVSALQMSSKPAVVAEAPVVQAKAVTTVDVLVTRSAIPAGTTITQDMVDVQPWPKNLVLKDFIVSGTPEANIVGKITRSSLQEREPFLDNKLASPNEPGFLAAGLPAGMRAVTIAVDAVTGVAGFVYPGDHVDVLFTHNIPAQTAKKSKRDEEGSPDRPAYTEVLASNVVVLAINLRDASGKEQTQQAAPSSITLQVNAGDAENINLAQKVGTLSVVLRSLSDINNAGVANPTSLSSLTRIATDSAPLKDDSVKVIRR